MRSPNLTRWSHVAAALLLPALLAGPAFGQETPADEKPEEAKPAEPVSFMRDIAPIISSNCVACHNPKKAEGKYAMTTFASLAKGGEIGEGGTLEPGKPDESYLFELIGPDGEPRMPYKLDPLPDDQIALIERWITEGGKYDGESPDEDWTFALRRTRVVAIPEAYPVAVPVTAVAFSPDGQRVEASGYHELTAWKTADGALDGRLQGLPERIHDIAFSADGKWMAVACGDPGVYGLVKLWSITPGEPPKPALDLAESSDVVFAVAFSPDGGKLATAGADRIVRVHETATGKILVQIEDHADWIYDLAFSPDGKLLATASRDKTAKVFDIEKKESLVTFTPHAAPVHAVAFAADGKSVFSGGADNLIRVWTIEDEAKQTRQIGGFGGAVFAMAMSPDGQTLAATGADKLVRLFKTADGAAIRNLEGHRDWVYSVAMSPDGKSLASGAWDGELRLWNIEDGKPLQSFPAAPGFKNPGDQASR